MERSRLTWWCQVETFDLAIVNKDDKHEAFLFLPLL